VAEKPDLAAILARARKLRGMSQRKLAELSGVSNTTIASLERGKGSRGSGPVKPSPETLKLLARGLAMNLLSGDVERREFVAHYTRLMESAGYSWVLQEPETMITIETATAEERENWRYEGISLTFQIGDLSDELHEAIGQGHVGASVREAKFLATMLGALLELVDPQYEFHERIEGRNWSIQRASEQES
jgi:transcriptional regulator with XRE-family HTH domain